MSDTRQDIYWKMYKDIWNFHLKFINNICDRQEFWDTVVAEMYEIENKYKGHKLIVSLLLAELGEFERIHKELKANADTKV